MLITKLLDNPVGRIVFSIILGLGLAALFRQVCKGDDCILIKGPKPSEIQKYYYKIDEDCFKYTPVVTKCDKKEDDETHVQNELNLSS